MEDHHANNNNRDSEGKRRKKRKRAAAHDTTIGSGTGTIPTEESATLPITKDNSLSSSSSHPSIPLETTGSWSANQYSYEVDYNDHFETPSDAYVDILPLLDALQKQRSEHVIYDPYYCNGQTKRLLQRLGFERVQHEQRDFYEDIDQNTVPLYHTLVTNPPYSDQHKERCLKYCVSNNNNKGKPFFLLMPCYVATKQYFRRTLNDMFHDMLYVVPKTSYQYSHPDGTGHATSPFDSMWFVGGLTPDQSKRLQQMFLSNGSTCRVYNSYQQLIDAKVITVDNRPNPKQRKKRKRQKNLLLELQQQEQQQQQQKTDKGSDATKAATAKTTSNSKYRDPTTGKRIKKRF
ncbi:hypothetical protein IV203_022980 [Nitzschia inconspicua]|uniref:Uncharacterized protein n=1 Tax=Nitzschia inconspicua TaxID=303405 RepID=A0A9K3KC44_9STRA|nr:hypothetical protein IV203_022980 [Nitzschia inconspicua]